MALTIGQVAKTTGIAARTIRFYEAAGVLPAPGRNPSGYRQYTPEAVRQLLFVRRARVLGLSLRQLESLLAAIADGRGPVRPRVREMVRSHLAAVQGQIRDLRALEGQLVKVVQRMATPSRGRAAGPCRCLDLDAPPARRGRRDARRR
jgi:MerR family copper efflux transcriptional regulator